MSDKKFRELKIDEELRDLLPPLTEDEYKFLEDSIKEHGCTSPIHIWNDYIVDGHNRYGICKKYNYGFEVVILDSNYTKDDIIEWMLKNQLGRRNLNYIQRIIIAEKYRDLIEKQAKENQRSCYSKDGRRQIIKSLDTRRELAKIAGVSEGTYNQGKNILKSDNSEIIDKIIKGEISINKAYTILFPKSIMQKQRKPISNITIKHITLRSQGKCEICGWGGQGLEGVLVPHHIHKYSETKDNSSDNLVMICPNCHGIIHTLETCNDKNIKQNILNNINNDIKIQIENYLNKLK